MRRNDDGKDASPYAMEAVFPANSQLRSANPDQPTICAAQAIFPGWLNPACG
jgi:hypothetical protein